MKKIFFLLMLLSATVALKAQPHAIALEYNDDIFSRNLNITYQHSVFNDHARVYGGLKCVLNSKKIYFADIIELRRGTPDEHFMFYQPYNDVLTKSLGLKIGVEASLLKSGNDAEVYSFYDFQFYKSDGRLVFGGIDLNGQLQVVTPFPAYSGTFYLYEHHIGVGLRHRFKGAMIVKATAALGIFKLSETNNNSLGPSFNGERLIPINPQFSKMFGVGLEYAFNHKDSRARNRNSRTKRR